MFTEPLGCVGYFVGDRGQLPENIGDLGSESRPVTPERRSHTQHTSKKVTGKKSPSARGVD